MGRLRMPRFLLKLPSDERDELRLWMESGWGLKEARGDFVAARAGDTVSERGGGSDGFCAWRRCCSSGGLCGRCSSGKQETDADFFSSCSITAAYSRSISF